MFVHLLNFAQLGDNNQHFHPKNHLKTLVARSSVLRIQQYAIIHGFFSQSLIQRILVKLDFIDLLENFDSWYLYSRDFRKAIFVLCLAIFKIQWFSTESFVAPNDEERIAN